MPNIYLVLFHCSTPDSLTALGSTSLRSRRIDNLKITLNCTLFCILDSLTLVSPSAGLIIVLCQFFSAL